MSVAADRLHFDLDALLRELRRDLVGDGGARLLRELVRRGLADRDLIPAAGLVLELDQGAARRHGRAAV